MERAAASLAGVRTGIDRCVERLAEPGELERSAPAVSAWSVRNHLEHLYLSDRAVLGWAADALARPNPSEREQSPNEIAVTLLARGAIPRGRGSAPDFTRPTGLSPLLLQAGFTTLRAAADQLAPHTAELDACLHTLPHPALGHFTPAEWLRFLHLHHQHHHTIISDILAA